MRDRHHALISPKDIPLRPVYALSVRLLQQPTQRLHEPQISSILGSSHSADKKPFSRGLRKHTSFFRVATKLWLVVLWRKNRASEPPESTIVKTMNILKKLGSSHSAEGKTIQIRIHSSFSGLQRDYWLEEKQTHMDK